jgi:uncharacterized protein YaeQ
MSFAQGFYNLHVESCAFEQKIEAKFKLKTVLHPEETLSSLAARILIFSLNFSEQLKLSTGLFEPDKPCAYLQDFSENYLEVFFLGMPSLKIAKKYWNRPPTAVSVYCDASESFHELFKQSIPEITRFASGARYYQFEADFLTWFGGKLMPSSFVKINLIEDSIYVDIDQQHSSSTIKNLDLLEQYQMTLNKGYAIEEADLS